MRAELFRPDSPADVVAVAVWDDGRAWFELASEPVEGLDAVLRPTPVVVPEGFPRHPSTNGETVERPGSTDWFRVALVVRAPELGLAVRFVADDVRNGWDPAANYRTFGQQERRLASAEAVPGGPTTTGPVGTGDF